MGLPKELRRLLLMNASSFVIFNYIGIFVNLYIWEKGHRIGDVSWFNLVLFLFWAVSFAAGGRLLLNRSVRLLFCLSAACGGTAFLLLSFLQLESRLLWIAVIGMPVGMMWGFFSCAQNMMVTLSGRGRDIGSFFAASTTVSQIINMSVPLLSAQVIRWFGYGGSFALMLVFVAVMLTMAASLPRTSLREELAGPEPWHRQMRYSNVFVTRQSRWLLLSCMAAGFFLQFQNLFALLFTFSVTEDKTIIALLNTMYTLFSLLALYLYRRLKLKEGRWLLVSVLLLSFGFLLVLVPMPPLLIASNVLTTMGLFYFSTSWNGQQFRLISELSAVQQSRMLVWRECAICLTRCLMLLFVLSVEEFAGAAFIALTGLALTSLVVVPYLQSRSVRAQLPAAPTGTGQI
ncbi:hypothetical protein J31TS4_36360 [Paenibacillus sp. J31TS4]|uniref:MFS transporter n=1 Tax=Paenibacillus sp. J31TS4 TaxID=2807195 RepID=UPI001B29C178|nr:MFS transporter [Paenibacillus sp. J31TS4]GIP40356.1 hypothetical protein J31TS4_36360 [Paenibacillus sp. J31TS4]